MRRSWKSDQQWARRFLPEIKRILGEHLIGEAPYEEDAKRNTDLIVLRLEPVRVACRIRRYEYWERGDRNGCYRDQFTLRVERPSGVESELTKVLYGWGSYLFYGFSDPVEKHLHAWMLGDLGQFRLWHHRYLARHGGALPGYEHVNGDGSSTLRAFALTALPPEFVVARSLCAAETVAASALVPERAAVVVPPRLAFPTHQMALGL